MALQVRQAAHLRGALQRAAALLRPPQRLLHLCKHTGIGDVARAGEYVPAKYHPNKHTPTHTLAFHTVPVIPQALLQVLPRVRVLPQVHSHACAKWPAALPVAFSTKARGGEHDQCGMLSCASLHASAAPAAHAPAGIYCSVHQYLSEVCVQQFKHAVVPDLYARCEATWLLHTALPGQREPLRSAAFQRGLHM